LLVAPLPLAKLVLKLMQLVQQLVWLMRPLARLPFG
jgi:hypothetical protein